MSGGFGPLHASAVTDRPPSRVTADTAQRWFRDASSATAMDGTVLDASWLNMLVGNLAYLCTHAGIELANDQGVDSFVWDAIVAIVQTRATVNVDDTLTGDGSELSPLSASGLKTLLQAQLAAHESADNPHPQYALLTALAAKAALDSPHLTGVPLAPTAALNTNTTQIATMAALKAAVDDLKATLMGGAPSVALDTLLEIGNQLLTDESAVAALVTAVAGKQPLNANLTAIAALTPAAGKLLVGTAGAWAQLDATGIADGWGLVRDAASASGFKFVAASSGTPANVTYNTGNTIVKFTAAAATDVPIVAKAAAGQTANLQEWQVSSGTVVGYLASTAALALTTSVAAAADGLSLTQGTKYFGVTFYTAANVVLMLGGKNAVQQAFADLTLGNDAGTTTVRLRTAGADRLVVTSAGAQIVSGVLQFPDGTTLNGAMIRQLQLEVTELRLARTSFVNGWIDSLNTTADLATLTNCDTSVAGKITPTYTPGVNQIPVMTGATTSGVTISDTAHYAGRDAWHVGDGTSTWATGTFWDAYPSMTASMTVDFGVAKAIVAVALAASNGLNAGWTLLGSPDNATWTTLLTGGAVAADPSQHVYNLTSPGSYRYFKFTGTAASGSSLYLDQFELRTAPVYNNETIISNAFTSASAPSNGLVVAQIKAIDALVMGTDILAYFSRDNGTTWTAVTLTADEVPGDGTTIYSGSASVAGQPSGTALKVKLVSANAKNFELYALGGFYS